MRAMDTPAGPQRSQTRQPARHEALPHALRQALCEAVPPLHDAAGRRIAADAWARWPIEPLGDRGLAHQHLRLPGTGALARIPKQSQMRLAAADNLRYQAACFARAAPGGHVPRLLAQLPAGSALPHGALLVEEIEGRAARLPHDLGAIMRSLASLHALPVPDASGAAPLLHAADPLRDLLQEVQAQLGQTVQQAQPAQVTVGAQAGHGVLAAPSAGLQAVAEELQALRLLCQAEARPPRTLIAFDGHPGNFVIRADGRAMLVDLEKCRYSHPGLDLAHATLYTSTTWDVQVCAVLSDDALCHAYAEWERAVPPALADAARPWHVPLARAMWLWSLSWCAKWLTLSQRAPGASADGEDWSADHSDPALIAHVRERVMHYLSADGVAGARRGIDALARWCAVPAA